MSQRVPTPALDLWRTELARGERTPMTFDPLWAAACAEATAQEFADIPELRRRFLEDALTILRRAARAQRRQEAER